MNSKQRTQVNKAIRTHWLDCKRKGVFTYASIVKKQHPRFTRHNGLRLRRLMRSGWRYPRSTQGNRSRITKPLIGYRNPEVTRHCIKAYGKRIAVVSTIPQLEQAVKDHKIPVLSRTLGARSRLRILDYARQKNLPIMIRG